jgi:flavin-dependent dehydrogenase
MRETNVVIVGAGPSGTVCAYLLMTAGIQCILVDFAKFPREKICGGGLTPKAWRLLDQLMPGMKYDYNAVTHLRLLVGDDRECEFDAEDELRITMRRDFDHALLRHFIDAGGEFVNTAFDHFERQPDGRILAVLKGGEQIMCRYLIGADGSNSRVRRQLTGKRDTGVLAMEQYVEKSGRNEVILGLSKRYHQAGYYYVFPNRDYDVVGYGDMATTPDSFRQVLKDKGIAETKLRGAYIYLSNDYPKDDHIILIGDAGGFANRTTCEGLFDAFTTARNAFIAISEGRSFSDTNRHVFRKMKKELLFSRFFFSRIGFSMLRVLCAYPRLVKWCYDTKMKRESFFK